MSRTYDLVCPETKRAIWVGQNSRIYCTDEHIKRLAEWLHEHKGKAIFFVDEESAMLDDIEDKNWVGMEDDPPNNPVSETAKPDSL